MKRNKRSSRAMRHRKLGDKRPEAYNSRYGRKLLSGKMMYGPGCCGHTKQSRIVVDLSELPA